MPAAVGEKPSLHAPWALATIDTNLWVKTCFLGKKKNSEEVKKWTLKTAFITFNTTVKYVIQTPFCESSISRPQTLTEHSFEMKVSCWKCTVGLLMCVYGGCVWRAVAALTLARLVASGSMTRPTWQHIMATLSAQYKGKCQNKWESVGKVIWSNSLRIKWTVPHTPTHNECFLKLLVQYENPHLNRTDIRPVTEREMKEKLWSKKSL